MGTNLQLLYHVYLANIFQGEIEYELIYRLFNLYSMKQRKIFASLHGSTKDNFVSIA